ncbi:MAG: cardiolipin synthase [Clostridiales bacterium]|nr:cardiolipin synthase [Clostridiales bacterium]
MAQRKKAGGRRVKRKKWGKFLRIIFGRTTFVLLSLLLQIIALFFAFRWLSDHVFYIYGGFTFLSAVVVIYIINKRDNPSYQLAWIVPVLVFPVFGALFYIFLEMQQEKPRISTRLQDLIFETERFLKQDPAVIRRLRKVSRRSLRLAEYMNEYGGCPIYDSTAAEYFPLGDDMYPRLLEELKKAERYIFMEYFIIENGKMWDSILEILKEKAAAGVEVRVMYDGMCSLTLLPYHYPEKLRECGIQCKMFAPVRPALSTYQNNRDHRKITVIDGHTAFTGGVNLADEYINEKQRFGHWKDTALLLRGDAVTSFVMMFLQMWNLRETRPEKYENYLRNPSASFWLENKPGGYVMPYGDNPMDDETVGKYVYMDILNEAGSYVHIMTPYLILDSDTLTSLIFAAKRGIEVIIIMPHIPDKQYAYILARSYYEELITAGVRIYEYIPGFVHAKVFTSDGKKAVVGTINLDYRSLYLHYECAVYLYRCAVIDDIERDFQQTLERCRRITLEDCRTFPLSKKLAGGVLRLFAPLM